MGARRERGAAATSGASSRAARDELDAALALDPRFVLALLDRGGSSAAFAGGRAYIEEAEVNRTHASEAEGRMVDGVRNFLLARDAALLEAYHWLSSIASDQDELATARAMFERGLAGDARLDESREHLARARVALADANGRRAAELSEGEAGACTA